MSSSDGRLLSPKEVEARLSSYTNDLNVKRPFHVLLAWDAEYESEANATYNRGWLTGLCDFRKYSEVNEVEWYKALTEMYYYALESLIYTINKKRIPAKGLIRPAMLLPTALVRYTNMHKSLSNQNDYLKAMRMLRKIGVAIEWGSDSTRHNYTQAYQGQKAPSVRNYFGKGAIPMLKKAIPVIRICRNSIRANDFETKPDYWRAISEEVIYQLNMYAGLNNFKWEARLRADWRMLWENL